MAGLSPFEAEDFVKNLSFFSLEEIGSSKWLKQHDRMEQLNIQAHQSAISKHDEFVVDYLISYDKIAVLIHQMIAVETWKDNCLPLLMDKIPDCSSVKAYMIIYHEALICNLLEIALFNDSALKNLDSDVLLELVDYCHRKINDINLNGPSPDAEENILNETVVQSLTRQSNGLRYPIVSAAITFFRYISSLSNPPSCVAKINSLDMLVTITNMMESQWWIKKSKLGIQKYSDSNWIVSTDRFELTKIEANMWLCIYNLAMDSKNGYVWNNYRKNQVLKLNKYLFQTIIDQLPMLNDLSIFLKQMGVFDPSGKDSSMLLLEQIPLWREAMLQTDWKKLSVTVMTEYLSNDPESRRKEMASMAQKYLDMELPEATPKNPILPSCTQCNLPSTTRCSVCKKTWYCSRECQVKHWKVHKSECKE